MKIMIIDFFPDGTAKAIYSEEIDLEQLGKLDIRRASHVEPDADGLWWVDLSPVNGPQLGPFAKRSQALSAEHEWLERHLHSWCDQCHNTGIITKRCDNCFGRSVAYQCPYCGDTGLIDMPCENCYG
jgi:predicted RNA-binding Zn-ribbon protein involved in translation (DUF1610 family)